MSPRVLTLAARLGFGLLLGGLVAFELLFVREARDGAAALEATRALKVSRAEAALDEALRGALEVGLTRLEVVETLPLADEDGLLWRHDGVLRLPRRVRTERVGVPEQAHVARVLEVALERTPPDAFVAEVTEALARGVVPPAIEGVRWSPALAKALAAERWEEGGARLALWTWVLEQADPPDEVVGVTLPTVVLRAWSWLEREEAATACLRAQRLAATRRLDTERLAAACQRGLSPLSPSPRGGKGWGEGLPTDGGPHAAPSPRGGEGWGEGLPTAERAQPRLVGDWLIIERDGDVRGVRVSLSGQLADVETAMRERGALATDERLVVESESPGLPSPRPSPPRGEGDRLVWLHLESPPLDAAAASLRSALVLKSALLAFTALLGLGVVLLVRLASRRREEVLAAQREFIATVSHELRTPLAGIRLMAETLERKLPTDGPARDYPRRLVQATDALGFLVENILSFNRLDSGRWTPHRAPFELSALEPMLRDDAALAVDAEVRVHCEGLAALPAVSVDAELIRILVLNLLRNAWKYGQRRPVRFEVSGRVEGASVVLGFTDNGPGIPPEAWESVFAAFHRLPREAGRAVGGSGLGLALARRIAELHGGTLKIAAASSEGTRFELSLPSPRPSPPRAPRGEGG